MRMGIRYQLIRMENVRRGTRIGIEVIGNQRERGVGRVSRGRDVSFAFLCTYCNMSFVFVLDWIYVDVIAVVYWGAVGFIIGCDIVVLKGEF